MKNLPNKIYLNFGDITKEEFEADDYNEFCKLDEYAVTYCEDMVYDTDVEYVRKDVFIEESCEKLEKCMYDNLMFQGRLHRKEVIDTYIDSLQEEPVSEDLEEEIGIYIKMNGYDGLDSIEEVKYIANHFAKWQKEHLWKPADGEDLPEIDREVVAFQETFPTDVDVPSLFKIVMAHRPNPKGYDGKSITTGQVEHYTPKTYDKGGWNIPDVKYWLDCSIPKEIEQYE